MQHDFLFLNPGIGLVLGIIVVHLFGLYPDIQLPISISLVDCAFIAFEDSIGKRDDSNVGTGVNYGVASSSSSWPKSICYPET